MGLLELNVGYTIEKKIIFYRWFSIVYLTSRSKSRIYRQSSAKQRPPKESQGISKSNYWGWQEKKASLVHHEIVKILNR